MNKKSPDVRKAAERSARVHVLAGLAVIVLVLGGTAVWAARTEISGAVVSSGLVVVESKVKKVQHPTGGVVSEITVKNGSRVKAGDLLVRLDETVSRANLQVITKQLDELVMREARLEAQRAFDTHKTPELNGNIVSVSADLTVDQMTGVPYYLARISIPRTELARLKQKHLVPGMPAEIYVRTQNRTVLSYLFKPIEDQMERAFRER